MSKQRLTRCSFCGSSSAEIGPIVEGPSDVYICEKCVELAAEIIRTEKTRNAACSICERPDAEVGWLTLVLGGALVCPFCLEKLVTKALAEKQQT